MSNIQTERNFGAEPIKVCDPIVLHVNIGGQVRQRLALVFRIDTANDCPIVKDQEYGYNYTLSPPAPVGEPPVPPTLAYEGFGNAEGFYEPETPGDFSGAVHGKWSRLSFPPEE